MSFKIKCAVAALALPLWAGAALAGPCSPARSETGFTPGTLQPGTL